MNLSDWLPFPLLTGGHVFVSTVTVCLYLFVYDSKEQEEITNKKKLFVMEGALTVLFFPSCSDGKRSPKIIVVRVQETRPLLRGPAIISAIFFLSVCTIK